MQTKPKANSIITHLRDPETGVITFNVRGAGEFTFDPVKASAAVRERAMVHGFIQRISDGGALSRNPEDGSVAMPADKMARMRKIVDHYESGTDEWSLKRAEGEGPDAGLIITAMTRALTDGNIDKANALVAGWMDKKSVDRKSALRAWAQTKEVGAAIAAIRAERAKGDANAMIEEILGSPEDDTAE